jgi:hypothetical protein
VVWPNPEHCHHTCQHRHAALENKKTGYCGDNGVMAPKPGETLRQNVTTKEERETRNHLIYARFLAGQSEREIGRAVGITGQRVHAILKTELKNAARHHKLLTDEALEMYVARLETLLRATWPKVLLGDLKAVETARHILEQQARLYDLEGPRVPAMPMRDQVLADESNPTELDELTKFRMKHQKGTG